ncbi:MAG: hypothetical protein GX142_09110 [Chloroflexi bacterium]|jgi:hypothetical protein|nr:hypothetical protein [Chloroflexota bacterium]
MNEASFNPTELTSPLAQLFEKAHQQGYLTYEEILAVMPASDQDLDQLDQLFGALLAAGIPYGDASDFGEESEKGHRS